MRLLLHHAEDQIRVNAVARAVLPYERVEPRAARRPAPLAPLALAVARARRVGQYPLALDVVNARALDEGRDVAAFVPDTLRALVRLVNLHLRAADEVYPNVLRPFTLLPRVVARRRNERRFARAVRLLRFFRLHAGRLLRVCCVRRLHNLAHARALDKVGHAAAPVPDALRVLPSLVNLHRRSVRQAQLIRARERREREDDEDAQRGLQRQFRFPAGRHLSNPPCSSCPPPEPRSRARFRSSCATRRLSGAR